MRKTLLSVVGLLVVVTLLMAPLQGSVKAQTTVPPQPERQYEELPQEVIDAFADGMTVDEFLAQNKGPIPMALWDLTDKKIAVVIEMGAPALLSNLMASGKTPESAPAFTQQNYSAQLMKAQDPLVSKIATVGGNVISRYTKVYNGVLAMVPGKEINALRGMAGVKAIHNAPLYEPTLAASVPLIQADDVWAATPGYDGTGVTIAVIDTGIDYTHAALGGAGTVTAYADNDPDVIEAGSFPTAKVIGGYDFAGTNYDAGGDTDEQLIPVPDDDPLDEGGHGTHVASTAAGMGVEGVIGKGVAPAASLYAFKVFGAEGSTNLVVDALERAMDPNGDGDLSDRVDVINMSLGSSWGVADPNDPEQVAVDLISQMGTVVVISSGNSGNASYVTGAPGVADSAITVAASTTGYVTMPVVKYNNDTQMAPYQTGNSFTTAITAPLVDVDRLDGDTPVLDENDDPLDFATGELCFPSLITDATALEGKIALVQRGICSFAEKIQNADDLGALGVIIYNDGRPEAEEFFGMNTVPATLPAGSTVHSIGLALKAFHNTTVTVGPDSVVKIVPFDAADKVASFSSRGPRAYDSKLKPEITAPGVAIYAAAMGTGSDGVSYDGTSMAAPHVSGVAALMKQAHPDWTVEQIKAAMMNTADDLNATDTKGYQVIPRTGAGRVNAFSSVNTTSIATGDADLVSLSWGTIEFDAGFANYIVPEAKQIRLQNLAETDRTYDIAVNFTSTSAGVDLQIASSVTVPQGGMVALPITLTLHPSMVFNNTLEESYGFITFTPTDGGNIVRVPFYFIQRPYNTLTELSSTKTVSADGVTPAVIDFAISGSTVSNLYPTTLVGIDPNEPEILDRGDLRAVGMRYSGTWDEGNELDMVFANWGAVHTPQNVFSETDVYLDVDRDGVPDYVLFNYNAAKLKDANDNDDQWIVLAYDLKNALFDLASPVYAYADFDSGVMAWWLFDKSVGLSDTNSRFDYAIYSYDGTGAEDEGPAGTFDMLQDPYISDLSAVNSMPPVDGAVIQLSVYMNSGAGYLTAKPLGVLLADFNGQPGTGQAYVIHLDATGIPTIYLPLIGR
ncbi:subtilisin-like serine protease [Longilinea arvoryzae]|uniref:Subtilisin-like serine protease n=1 Tax=Longilinea arvoryzae TaxID=360412 RepID=A0A0S7BNL2_9CHLR|nr:S8 family serine peptidase [Longilinea arvoryzae]GAP15890.1 subtilisin-like serine protease [Longilinea arvoryzae]